MTKQNSKRRGRPCKTTKAKTEENKIPLALKLVNDKEANIKDTKVVSEVAIKTNNIGETKEYALVLEEDNKDEKEMLEYNNSEEIEEPEIVKFCNELKEIKKPKIKISTTGCSSNNWLSSWSFKKF